MNSQMVSQAPKQSPTPSASGLLQRKCDKCRKKKIIQRSAKGSAPDTVPQTSHSLRAQDAAKRDFMEPQQGYDFSQIPVHSRSQTSLQAKLAVNAPGDIYEQEADRVADQLMAMPARAAQSSVPPRIQRYSGQATGQVDTVPASIDRVLASSGRPLEPAIQQDMGQRFGYDFSHVRVHSGTTAEQSAQDVNANAYTVGHDIVFGASRFAPGTNEGQRLLAHELAHVIQQGFAPMEPGSSHEMRQNPSGLGTKQDALLRQRTPLLIQRAPSAASAAKVQVKDDQPRHAAIDVRDRVPVPPGRTREKILKFNEHNSDLGADVLSKIQSGILIVTGKAQTDEVAYSFFDFYSGSGHSLRKMTADEEKKAKVSDRLAETSPGIFVTTTLRSDALSLDAVKLADLLLHEFAHTGDIAGNASGAGSVQEGHAYGIEYFYAKTAGDMKRANTIQGIVADGDVLGYSKAYDLPKFQEDFKVTYALMTALREVVTNGSSSHLPFPKLTSADAQLIEQQVVVSFQSPGDDLKTYIAHVKATLDSFEIPRVK